ncbi:tRNA (adenosine(37)-N6)-threonylcarbamoyltransferase complex dimerization subunit type 1 TsaB [Candidatus Dependentiae bacterium]|nr:tRNA (adenosine(37)-N6)-threonylcarbamoyltransferase complex dimerization subunit type 1 TsaB [Candidatus Dependentiae bacterium]
MGLEVQASNKVIIGIDTSTEFLKLGIAKENLIISELLLKVKDSHTRYLLSGLNFLLVNNNLVREDVDGFGIVIGPGSFTGLRIGLATIMGIISAWKVPAYPVMSGDIAWRANLGLIETKHFFYILDGKRKELFVMHYVKEKNSFKLKEDIVALNYQATIDIIKSYYKEGVTLIGNGINILRESKIKLPKKIKIIEGNVNGFTGGDIAKFTFDASAGQAGKIEPLYVRDADIRT